ncbi:tight adherence protein C [Frischella perrara]|uniref:Flp pilus assembly protein TadC n=1 Tax=Frischella perrara TaxID=1267021 RepID=A0A0A7S2T1_FRIPE|nr:type II secretion system F family protein [Frischella perrara]AJA45152.1 Flp pilus assembly protein TadC [Frischella perrara]PWV66173.1 tight adherence protein C [Frischella perrara]
MMLILVSLCLIFFALKELINEYQYQKQKKTLTSLLKEEVIKPKTTNRKNNDVAFEKIIAQNSVAVSFLNRFQDEQLWKVYAIVVILGILFLINSIFDIVNLDETTLIVSLFLIAVVIIIIPERLVKAQTAKRIRGVSRDLPLVIDIIAIMVKSGMTVENSFNYLSTRTSNINKDIETILERACLMMEVNGIEQAIDLIYREVPSKEMRMFCTTLKRNISYGDSIYITLLNLSSEIREMQRLSIEEKIAAVSAKMTVPMMVFILFPSLVVIAGPIILKILSMPVFNN